MTPAAAILCTGVLAAVVVVALLAGDRILKAWAQERAEWNRERQILLNRIKPETAQQIDGETGANLPAVGWDDDKGYWDAQSVLSKEQLADMLMEEVDGRAG